MTAARKELTGEQVLEIQDALKLADDDGRVWCLAIDPKYGAGSADVLAADNVIWFVGGDMELCSRVQYRTGTLQITFKRKDRPRP